MRASNTAELKTPSASPASIALVEIDEDWIKDLTFILSVRSDQLPFRRWLELRGVLRIKTQNLLTGFIFVF